jgi:hypothetical protein
LSAKNPQSGVEMNMKNPAKLKARLEKAAARFQRKIAAMKAKAARKISKLEAAIKSDEAKVRGKYEKERAKLEAKLAAASKPAGDSGTRKKKAAPKSVVRKSQSTKVVDAVAAH